MHVGLNASVVSSPHSALARGEHGYALSQSQPCSHTTVTLDLARKGKVVQVDVNGNIGRRIRQRRTDLGLKQIEVAERLGVSFQQIHRLESSTNQITVTRLWQFARALNVPVYFFFAGLDD